MTQTTKNRLFAALAVLIGLIAVAAVVLTAVAKTQVMQPQALTVHHTALALPVVPEPEAAQADPLVAEVLGEDGHLYTTVQAALVQEAGNRVCEGFTAQVPLVDMEPEIAREFGLSGEDAHEFVAEAHRLYCPLA